MAYGAILGQTTTGSGTGQPPATGDVFGQYIGKTYTGSLYAQTASQGSLVTFTKIYSTLTLTITNYNGWWTGVMTHTTAEKARVGAYKWFFIDSTGLTVTLDMASDLEGYHVFNVFDIGGNNQLEQTTFAPHNATFSNKGYNMTATFPSSSWASYSRNIALLQSYTEIYANLSSGSTRWRVLGYEDSGSHSLPTDSNTPAFTLYYGGSGLIVPTKNTTDRYDNPVT